MSQSLISCFINDIYSCPRIKHHLYIIVTNLYLCMWEIRFLSGNCVHIFFRRLCVCGICCLRCNIATFTSVYIMYFMSASKTVLWPFRATTFGKMSLFSTSVACFFFVPGTPFPQGEEKYRSSYSIFSFPPLFPFQQP